MSAAKTSSYPRSVEVARAGTTKAGSAPGGYSTRKSRYGTPPSAILSP